MSTQINANVLKNFIVKTLGADKLTQNQAQRYKIDNNEFAEANENDNNFLELDEILENDDIYDKFATLYNEDVEKKQDATDKEKEKEEANKVKDKSDSKA